jgi:hypothetical protein
VLATITSPTPQQIAQLPAGTIIEALAVALESAIQANQAAQARATNPADIMLQTAFGNVVVNSNAEIGENALLQIQILPPANDGSPQLRILSINGVPPSGNPALATSGALNDGPLQSLSNAPDAAAPESVSATSLNAANPDSVVGIMATIVRADPAAALPTGATFLVRLASASAPGAIPVADFGGSPPGASGPLFGPLQSDALAGPDTVVPPNLGPDEQHPAPPGGLESVPARAGDEGPVLAAAAEALSGPAAPEPLPSSPDAQAISSASDSLDSEVSAQPGAETIVSDTPQIAARSEISSTVTPQTIAGTIAPNSLAGAPLVQTNLGLISLDSKLNLVPGSNIVLDVLTAPSIPDPANTHEPAVANAPPIPSALSSPMAWPALTEAIQTLHTADPAAAQILAALLPDPTSPAFVPNVVALVTALQSGNVRTLIGERVATAIEKTGRGGLLDKIGSDMRTMSQPVTLPTGGAWQSLSLPMMFGHEIERIRLTVRRPAEDEEAADGRAEEGVRFLVDLDMSRLGPMQLDGLVKRRVKRFDLILRSRRALPDPMRRDIGAIFARALEGLGMTGQSQFQLSETFVEPIPLRAAPAAGWTA